MAAGKLKSREEIVEGLEIFYKNVAEALQGREYWKTNSQSSPRIKISIYAANQTGRRQRITVLLIRRAGINHYRAPTGPGPTQK